MSINSNSRDFQVKLERERGFIVVAEDQKMNSDLESLVSAVVKEFLIGHEQETRSFSISLHDQQIAFTRLDQDGNAIKVPVPSELVSEALSLLSPGESSINLNCDEVNAENLFHFMKDELVFSSSSFSEDGLLKRLVRAIKKYCFLHLVLEGDFKGTIRDRLSGKSRDEVREFYLNPVELYDTFLREIDLEYEWEDLVTKRELVDFLDDMMRSEIQKTCVFKRFSLFSKKEFKELDFERICVRESLRTKNKVSDSSTLQAYSLDEDRSKLKAKEYSFPFAALAKIPVTEQNKDFIRGIWKDNLTCFFYQAMDAETPVDYQLNAIEYIKGREEIPEDIEKELEALLDTLDEMEFVDEMKVRIVRNFSSEKKHLKNLKTEGSEYYREYTEILMPAIEQKIKNTLYENHQVNGTTIYSNQIDIERLLFLVLHGDIEKKDGFQELDCAIFAKDLGKRVGLEHLKSPDLLQDIICLELEALISRSLNLLPKQMELLEKHRKEDQDEWLQAVLYHDDVIKSVMTSNKNFMEEIGLTRYEIAQLINMGQYMVNICLIEQEVSNDKLTELLSFIEYLSENPSFYRRLKNYSSDTTIEDIDILNTPILKEVCRLANVDLVEKKTPPYGLDADCIKLVRKIYCYISRIDEYEHVLVKAENLRGLIEANIAIPVESKFNRHELGALSELVGFFDQNKVLIEPMQDNENIKKLIEINGKALDVLSSIDEHLSDSVDGHYNGGDIAGHKGSYVEEMRGRSLPTVEHLTAKLFTYHHGEVLYRDREGKIHVSQIYKDHETKHLSLAEISSIDVFRIDPCKLFSKEIVQEMQKHYGDDWESKVKNMYIECANKVHQQGKFKEIYNDIPPQLQAGRAHFDWFLRYFVEEEYRSDYTGHRGPKKRDFDKITDNLMEGKASKTMICSEFATRTTIAALVLLNREITKDLIENKKKNDSKFLQTLLKEKEIAVPYNVQKLLKGDGHSIQARKDLEKLLIKAGLSKEESRVDARIASGRIFDLPYDEHERLKRVHPGRMVTLLQKKGCLEQVPPPPKVLEIISI